MQLVEQHIIKKSNHLYKELDKMCLNGALNILRKEIPNAFNEGYGIEVCSMPLVLTIK